MIRCLGSAKLATCADIDPAASQEVLETHAVHVQACSEDPPGVRLIMHTTEQHIHA